MWKSFLFSVARIFHQVMQIDAEFKLNHDCEYSAELFSYIIIKLCALCCLLYTAESPDFISHMNHYYYYHACMYVYTFIWIRSRRFGLTLYHSNRPLKSIFWLHILVRCEETRKLNNWASQKINQLVRMLYICLLHLVIYPIQHRKRRHIRQPHNRKEQQKQQQQNHTNHWQHRLHVYIWTKFYPNFIYWYFSLSLSLVVLTFIDQHKLQLARNLTISHIYMNIGI